MAGREKIMDPFILAEGSQELGTMQRGRSCGEDPAAQPAPSFRDSKRNPGHRFPLQLFSIVPLNILVLKPAGF